MSGKILIVDDDIDTLQLVGTMLERQGFKILAANNGEQALIKAQAEKPDLIIMDVMMPGMDGYEATRRIRATDLNAKTPILMFTAKTQMDDKVEGFEAGVDDYITKPIHPAELIATVKKLLTRPQTSMLVMPEDGPAEEIEGAEVVGVLAAKAGVGVSTLAINLAVSMNNILDDDVILAEMRPGLGDVGIYLGFPEPNGLDDLLKRSVNEIRQADVEGFLKKHQSGIKVLLASHDTENLNLVQGIAQYETIIGHLKRLAPKTVLDMGVGLNEANRKLVSLCSSVIVIVEPSPHVVIHTKRLIDSLEGLGLQLANIHVVMVSRQRLEIALSPQKIQQGVDMELAGVISAAPELAYQSLLRQQPLVLAHADSITSRQIMKLAQTLFPKEE